MEPNQNMPEKWCSLLLGLFVLSLASVTSSTSSNELFTSSFLVRFKRSVDNNVAHEIAKRNSFHNVGPVSGFHVMFFIYYVSFILSHVGFHRFIPHRSLFFCLILMDGKVNSIFKFIEMNVDLLRITK